MKELERKILKDGVIINNDILKVDSFLNHQIDTAMVVRTSSYIAAQFEDIDKIVTVETSGIAYAIMVAMAYGNIPVVFAKKTKSAILDYSNAYHAEVKSFTRNTVSEISIDKRFIKEGERVLIVDDFLAEGNASVGLVNLCKDAKADVQGVAVIVEKRFQGGRDRLEAMGIKVVSCASIEKFENNKPVFSK
ncbi:MAG: xanthine phosphoribosyltransferase [Bacilli bacterium]|nr:xanthine phosphoribosyltransferase [Bacilli bacterium]